MNTNKKNNLIFACVFVVFTIYALSVISPFVWVFLNSLKGKEEYLHNQLALPQQLNFSVFRAAFDAFDVYGVKLIGMFQNSIIYTVCSTALSVISCTVTAYCVSKYQFAGRKVLYFIAIMIMLVPTIGSMPAMYQLTADIGLKDNVMGISLLWASGFGFNFLLLYSYFRSVSWTYAEAAQVDGAGDFLVFFKVMIPQVLPAMAAASIVTGISVWNDYLTPFLYLENAPTVAYGLYDFQANINHTMDYPMLFAGIFISTVPMIVLFVVFQKTIINNTVAGGLKG